MFHLMPTDLADCDDIDFHRACALNEDHCIIQSAWFQLRQGTVANYLDLFIYNLWPMKLRLLGAVCFFK